MISALRTWVAQHLLQNELFQRVLRNTAYLFSSSGFSAGLSMLQGILAARLLGVAGFGVLGSITMFTSVVNKLISFRMNELIVKYVGKYHTEGDPQRAAAVFKAASLAEMTGSLLAYALIWLLAPLGALYLAKDSAATNWFLVYGLVVVANLIAESSTGLLQIQDRFRRIAAVNVLQSLVTLSLIAVAFVYYDLLGNPGEPMLAVILAYMAGKLVNAGGLTLAALGEARQLWGADWWQAPLARLRREGRELVHFAVSTNLSATINLVNKDSELLWVAFFRDPVETGYYKLALALANVMQLPVSPMPQATYPELSREAARQNWRNLRYVLRQGTLLAGGYSLLSAAFLVIFGQWIIQYIYEPQFLPAYPALVVLVVAFLIANSFYWNRTALLALGLPDYPTKVNLAAAGFKIAGAFILVPVWGAVGSAALLASYYLFSITLNVRKALTTLAQREAQQPAGQANA